MAIKVRVKAEAVIELKAEDYEAQWMEQCDDSGDMEEGDEYPSITDEFIREKFEEGLETGEIDLSEVMETASIDVTPA